jgi:hypothetical protein
VSTSVPRRLCQTRSEVWDIGGSGVSYDHPTHVEIGVIIILKSILARYSEEWLEFVVCCILWMVWDVDTVITGCIFETIRCPGATPIPTISPICLLEKGIHSSLPYLLFVYWRKEFIIFNGVNHLNQWMGSFLLNDIAASQHGLFVMARSSGPIETTKWSLDQSFSYFLSHLSFYPPKVTAFFDGKFGDVSCKLSCKVWTKIRQ